MERILKMRGGTVAFSPSLICRKTKETQRRRASTRRMMMRAFCQSYLMPPHSVISSVNASSRLMLYQRYIRIAKSKQMTVSINIAFPGISSLSIRSFHVRWAKLSCLGCFKQRSIVPIVTAPIGRLTIGS